MISAVWCTRRSEEVGRVVSDLEVILLHAAIEPNGGTLTPSYAQKFISRALN